MAVSLDYTARDISMVAVYFVFSFFYDFVQCELFLMKGINYTDAINIFKMFFSKNEQTRSDVTENGGVGSSRNWSVYLSNH